MEIVKTEDIKEKTTDSLSTIKVSSGIKYMEQVNFRCDISVNQAGFEFIKCEKSPEVGKNTCYDTEMRIKTEAENEVDTQEHVRWVNTEDNKINSEQIVGKEGTVDISVQEAGCVKCEINPKEEETTGYDTEMRIKTEIRDEAGVDHGVNYEPFRFIKVEDYKIEPYQECMEHTTTDNLQRSTKVTHEGNVEHLKCQHCDYITKRPTSLKIHFTIKHNENAELYQCSDCEYKTTHKRYLLEHHKWKHDNSVKIFHCEQCKFKTKTKYNLSRHHRLRHDSVEVLRCKFCDYKTKTKSCLLQHHISKHNVAEFFHCELCDFKTKYKKYLLRHHKVKHGDASGIFHCELCDFKTKYRCNYLEHRTLKHFDTTESFHCAQCDFKTKYKYNLLKHHRSMHDDAAEIYHCDKCNYKTKNKNSFLDHHRRSHD